MGFSASPKQAIFEIPGKQKHSVETRFHEKRGGYPTIHLKTEVYKTWDFQHCLRKPSLKSQGKPAFFRNPISRKQKTWGAR